VVDKELYQPSTATPSHDRRSDPDRTPLPVADDDALFARAEPAAPATPLGKLESKPVLATRVALAAPPVGALAVPDQAQAKPLDPDYLRDQLALLDTERILCSDSRRAAHIAHTAARIAEKLGDTAGGVERFETALELDPGFTAPLRGLRRLRAREGKRDVIVGLLEREIERTSGAERRGLVALRADLCLAIGDREGARAGYRVLVADGPDLGGALGLCDLAAAEGVEAELTAALALLADALAPTGATRARAAVAVERARLDEAAGRTVDAIPRYREALALDAQAAGAAWGLVRIALRTPGEADDVEAHARLVDLIPASPLKVALERRLGLLRARAIADDGTAARASLQAAATGGDALSLLALVDLERTAGRLDDAAAALTRAVDGERDTGRRADLLVRLGELHEKRAATADALAAFSRAATEYPDDPRARRAIERAQLIGGDKESDLKRHLAAADRDPARAPVEWVHAARLLGELGRRDEALARLAAALAQAPAFGPALDLAVELHLAADRPADAAALLQRAAEAGDDATRAGLLRERAARLWAKAGQRTEALAVLRPLLISDDARAARWTVERLLAGGTATELAESLRAEAEACEDDDRARAAELWHRRGLLLANTDLEAALDSQRRSLALDPDAGPAAVAVAAQLMQASPRELPSVYQARLAGAGSRPESAALLVRLGAALENEAHDLAAAQHTYAQVAAQLPDWPIAVEALDRVARRAGDDALVVEALDRELASTSDPEARFALLIAVGERLATRLHQPERAGERFRQALELRPHHPLAAGALERSLRASRNLAALADLALSDLKDAPDAKSKVAAYERLAFVDGELRGDTGSALLAYESVVEIDPANHPAMRVLEKHYLRERRWPELCALYEQLGLTASDPTFAAAVHLDRARLRLRVAADVSQAELEGAVDNDNRLALFKDGLSRPALRHLLGRARAANDLPQVAELSARLADAVGDDGRTAGVCLTRAAEALVDLDREDDARARFAAALERSGLHLPALRGLLQLCIRRGDWKGALEAAEQEGQALRDQAARARAYLIAGAIADEHLKDPERALGDLRQALAIDARDAETFDRLRRVLERVGDFPSLAELFKRRLEVETDGARLVTLHLELARLARDQLHDNERARNDLRAVLIQDAAHPEALALLADLHFADEQWAEAAEVLIKRARVEKTRSGLKDIFFKLGVIYADHLPDPKRAVASFTRVVKADPNDKVALEHLSSLYLKEWDWVGALEATTRLADLESDKVKKVSHLHRIAKIQEEGFKDARHAHEALKQALDLDPMYLSSIGELAKFFDRQSDVQSMRVHLDRTAARVRTLLDRDPYDVQAYHALVKIFGWRRTPDRAAMAAGVLEHLGSADTDEKLLVGKLTARDGYPGKALADGTLDETLFDARLPAGFRHLFRLLDEPLGKLFRADLRRLGVQKSERITSRGHPVREVANKIAADLDVRDFDLYVTAAHPAALVLELTEPVSLVIGNRLVEGAVETEVRFLVGRLLKMLQCKMALPMRLGAEELGVLVGAIVRQFNSDFVPAGFDEARVALEATRLAKAVPRKMKDELFPFAMECADARLDFKTFGPALVETANRAGLLTVGLIGPALTALRRLGDEAQVRGLLKFSVSEELAELRRQAGTSLG
jgi:tetratricopeptide (TPR) repeat protein